MQHAPARLNRSGRAPSTPIDGPKTQFWKSFLGEAPERPFDANRYINWRFFWDYSGGNIYENMCHQLAFWYKAMGLGIPRKVTMTGGLSLWKDGREVMNVSIEHEELLYSWDSSFGDERLGVSDSGITHTMQRACRAEKKRVPENNTRWRE